MLYPVSFTVPAAGSKTKVDNAGCSVIGIRIPAVPDGSENMLVSFDGNESRKGEFLPWAVLSGNAGKGFRYFTVEGTAESAGNEVTLLISDEKIEQSVTLNPDQLYEIEISDTFNKASTDLAQSLAVGEYTNSGILATACTITAEGNPIRIAFNGVAPDQTANPNGLGQVVPAGGFRRIVGIRLISTLQFISAAAGVHASVNFQMEF